MPAVGIREWVAAGQAIANRDLLRNSGKGRFTETFERRMGERIGAKHVLCIHGGTTALIACLAAAGIGPGDEVLVPAYTWMSTAAAPVQVGAVPILVDIDETLGMDPSDIERKITPYTRAIMPVHMVNVPCNMDAIMRIAKKHNLVVIEDACQAVGVRYRNQHLGAIGDAGAFSFNQFKNINIGEGGAVITNNDKIFARARNYSDLGSFVRGHADTYNEPTFVGFNARVTEVDGAMLCVQLDKLDGLMKRLRARRLIAEDILSKSNRFRISPHNDPTTAVSLTVIFETREQAMEMAKMRGVFRLQDNSKHVYTNWEPILSKRTFHPKLNPWAWAQRPIEYNVDMCARTLDILERTCRINLGEQYPTPVVSYLMKRLVA